MSHTLDIQHFVFCTKHRQKVIPMDRRRDLYRFLWKKAGEYNCHVYRINGMTEHVHMVVDLHPTISKSDFANRLKSTSSQWMKKCGLFPGFTSWGEGYFSESKDLSTLDTVVNYVRNQENHHVGKDFLEEIRQLYSNSGREWDDQDLQ